MGFYIPEDDVLHSYRRENLKSYEVKDYWIFVLLFIFWYSEGRQRSGNGV
jgi:hypothetical protein